MITTEAAPDILAAPSPRVTEAEAEAIALAQFGVAARAENLASERDTNFRLRIADGPGYTLKFANPAEPEANTDFQIQALLHIERVDPGLPAPKVRLSRDGRQALRMELSDGRASLVRLVSWLDGEPVHRVPMTPALRRDIGTTLARMGRALAGFDHPASGLHLMWDIKNAAELLPLIDFIPDTPMRERVRGEVTRIVAETLPALSPLRRQVIHNDLNHHNILVDPARPDRISGVIDFGDMVKTPLAIDVAVAAAYFTAGPDALADVVEMVAAYHAVTPLERSEVVLLRDLIVARLCTTITITDWRAARYPENAAYILRNNGPARAAMAGFAALPRDAVTRALLTSCGLE